MKWPVNLPAEKTSCSRHPLMSFSSRTPSSPHASHSRTSALLVTLPLSPCDAQLSDSRATSRVLWLKRVSMGISSDAERPQHSMWYTPGTSQSICRLVGLKKSMGFGFDFTGHDRDPIFGNQGTNRRPRPRPLPRSKPRPAPRYPLKPRDGPAGVTLPR